MSSKSSSGGMDYTISLKNVSKSFRRTNKIAGYTTLKSGLLSLFGIGKPRVVIEAQTVAVNDITLRVPKGSSFGVIGKNGSGKSTLLKLITGIYRPDKGEIFCSGKISALIELGAGFHPDFTGRENVYLGGMIQGLTRKEIDAKFNDIVHFAELEDFIDEPVRTYSSGMFMRLGFSLAIHAEPDVLLIDEVLAVGDEGFINKCKSKISSLKEQGVTLLLVTHDLSAVERWCDEVLWLHKGQVKDRGEPRRVIDAYRTFIEGEEEVELKHEDSANDLSKEGQPQANQEDSSRWGSREIEITCVDLLSSNGKEQFVFHPEDPCTVVVQYSVMESLPEPPVCGIAIHHSDGTLIFGTNSDIERISLVPTALASGSKGVITCEVKALSLLAGDYFIDIAIHRADGYPYDYIKKVKHFSIRSDGSQVGRVNLKTGWSLLESYV